ncbi:OB-fold nucleic acid binding domain-containing protein, partial [uncultured Thermosynechococcus sp.]
MADVGATGAEIRATRIEKAKTLQAQGMNPYAYRWERTHTAAVLQEKYAHLAAGEAVGDRVSVAGRIMARRIFGKLAFFTLQDDSGTIQLYLDKQTIT